MVKYYKFVYNNNTFHLLRSSQVEQHLLMEVLICICSFTFPSLIKQPVLDLAPSKRFCIVKDSARSTL